MGDLGGLEEIYDEEGRLMLKEDEEILRKVDNDNINVWKGKHGLTGKTLLGYSKEKGTMYLTDRRLVFIRTPDPWLALKTHGTPLELAGGITGSLYAKDLKRLGLRHFVELYYSEVVTYKSKKGKWAELRLDDTDGVPIRVDISRRGKHDDKIVLLEELLRKAGSRKLN